MSEQVSTPHQAEKDTGSNAAGKPPEVHVDAPVKKRYQSAWVVRMLFAMPAVLFLAVLTIFYVPQLFASPQYDFVYAVCKERSCNKSYTIGENGKLMRTLDVDKATEKIQLRDSLRESDGERSFGGVSIDMHRLGQEDDSVEFYRYRQKNGASERLTMAEVNQLGLKIGDESPDGYRLHERRDGDSGGAFVFYGSSLDRVWRLQKDWLYRPVSLGGNQLGYYTNEIKVVGWVNDGK